MGGGRRIQFRWEMYNVFNQVNWSAINTNAQFNPAGEQVNANFGKATSARDPRIMQGALGLLFNQHLRRVELRRADSGAQCASRTRHIGVRRRPANREPEHRRYTQLEIKCCLYL